MMNTFGAIALPALVLATPLAISILVVAASDPVTSAAIANSADHLRYERATNLWVDD